MPAVGNETSHFLDGLTVRGGLGVVGNLGATAYIDRDIAAKLAREQICNRAMGYYAETGPFAAAAAASVSINARIYGVAIGLLAGDVVSNLIVGCHAAATAGTTTKLAIASSTGTILVSSAECSSTFTSTGKKTVPMTAPYTILADGLYYALFLNNAGTGASLLRLNGGSQAFPAVTGALASGVNQDAQSDLPAIGSSATLAATANSFGYWIAVS